jgi:hypothetical protein
MTAFCPHCSEALSTYTTIADSESSRVEVLVCAHCDKVLGVVGPAGNKGRQLDVDQISDLLDVAINTDDESQARTVFMIVIESLNTQFDAAGGDDAAFSRLFEQLLRAHYEGQRRRKAQEEQAQADRGLHGRPT